MEFINSNIILYCNLWKQCTKFYAQDLHLPILFEKDWFIELKLTASSRLSLADARKTSIQSSHGRGLTLSLQVDDIESQHIRFQNKKMNPTPIRRVWGSKTFYLFDPEGNRIEFWS